MFDGCRFFFKSERFDGSFDCLFNLQEMVKFVCFVSGKWILSNFWHLDVGRFKFCTFDKGVSIKKIPCPQVRNKANSTSIREPLSRAWGPVRTCKHVNAEAEELRFSIPHWITQFTLYFQLNDKIPAPSATLIQLTDYTRSIF